MLVDLIKYRTASSQASFERKLIHIEKREERGAEEKGFSILCGYVDIKYHIPATS